MTMIQRSMCAPRHPLRRLCASVVRWGVIVAAASGATARAAYIYDPATVAGRPVPAAAGSGAAEVEKAVECYEQGQISDCLDFLRLARKGNPDVLPAEVILAELYLRDNQVAAAREMLEKAAAIEPACPQTYLLIARLALAEARATEAAALFEKAYVLAHAPGLSEPGRRQFEAEACAGLAAIAERRGDWPAAAARLGEWLDLNPRDGQVRERLARARFHQGTRDKVADELTQARRDDPTLDPPAIVMARLYTEVGQLDKAAEWVDYASRSAPQDAKAQLGAALWYLDQDQPERARSHAEAAATLDPASTTIKEARGLIAWHLKNYPDAERIFQEIVIDAPGNVGASTLWALALAEQPAEAKRRRALQLAESLARMDPNSGTTLTTLGRVYHRNGRPDDAERVLRAALASGTVSAEAPYYLARVLSDRGREAEVAPLLKLSLGATGRFAFRTEARQWLAKVAR
jgi:tetratricopeptide (TPR) repeat protein